MNKDDIRNYLNILKYSTTGSYIDGESIFKNAEFFFERVLYAAENVFTGVEIKMLYGRNTNWIVPTLSIHPIEPNEEENKGGYEILVHMWSYYDTKTTDDHKQINPEILLCELKPDGGITGDGWYGINVVVDKDGYNVRGSFKRKYFTQSKEFILIDNFNKIQRFIALIKSSVTISKTIAWTHSVCPQPEEYKFIKYRKWLEETVVELLSDIDLIVKDVLRHRLKRVINNEHRCSGDDDETELVFYEFKIRNRWFYLHIGMDLRCSIRDEYDTTPYTQINVGIVELPGEYEGKGIWDACDVEPIAIADFFIDEKKNSYREYEKKIFYHEFEKTGDMSEEEMNKLFGKLFEAIGGLKEVNNVCITHDDDN